MTRVVCVWLVLSTCVTAAEPVALLRHAPDGPRDRFWRQAGRTTTALHPPFITGAADGRRTENDWR
jgi:hypothetical protein